MTSKAYLDRSRERVARWCALALATLLVAAPSAANACSVCYGEPDSPATRGLTWAITALALIVVLVLAGVTAFFVHASRNPLVSEATLPEEH